MKTKILFVAKARKTLDKKKGKLELKLSAEILHKREEREREREEFLQERGMEGQPSTSSRAARNDDDSADNDDSTLFLPHATLKKVFAIIDRDESSTISGRDFLTALRNNTGNVSQILDSALSERRIASSSSSSSKSRGKKNSQRKFEVGSKIIATISSYGEKGIGLGEFVEAFRVAGGEDDFSDDGALNGSSSFSGDLSDADDSNSFRFSSAKTSPSSGEEFSWMKRESRDANERKTDKIDAVQAAILEKRENVEELKRVKRMTALVADACRSLIEKKMKKKEQSKRPKEGLKRFLRRVKNLKSLSSNNTSKNDFESDIDSESDDDEPYRSRHKRMPSFSKGSLSMAPGVKDGMTREKMLKKMLKQKMSKEMRALNDELYINAFVLLNAFRDLNYSGTGLIIVDGFLHVYERNHSFRHDLKKARNDTSSHSTIERDLVRTAMEMCGRRRESVDIVSFLSYFCRADSTLRPKLPPLPDIPMNDGMVSPAKASVEGSSQQRRSVLEAKIGIGSRTSVSRKENEFVDAVSVNSESTNDSTAVVPMKEGIAQHLKLTPIKSPSRALTSAMKKMKSLEETEGEEKEADKTESARQRLSFGSNSEKSNAVLTTESRQRNVTFEHVESNASMNTEKKYRILSMVVNEADQIDEGDSKNDDVDENEQANLRGLEMEALIHVLSMREMNKVHQ